MSEKAASRADLLTRVRSFRDDPLAKQYRRHRRPDPSPLTPEEVLGHRLLVMAGLLEDACRDNNDDRQLWPEMTDDNRWRFADMISSEAVKAVPHLWSSVGWHKAVELEMPRHVVSPRSLPLPDSWHTFAYLTGSRKGHDAEICDGVLIGDLKDKIVVCDIWSIAVARSWRTRVGITRIPYGSVWPDDFEGQPTKIRRTLQLLAFLSSPYIPRTRERMNRATRRELTRRGSVAVEDEVTFVLLRRTKERREHTETESEIEWKHRWIVSGHLRAQWYPSEQAHHLIWIAPYAKGPEDAPFLDHVYKVAR